MTNRLANKFAPTGNLSNHISCLHAPLLSAIYLIPFNLLVIGSYTAAQ